MRPELSTASPSGSLLPLDSASISTSGSISAHTDHQGVSTSATATGTVAAPRTASDSSERSVSPPASSASTLQSETAPRFEEERLPPGAIREPRISSEEEDEGQHLHEGSDRNTQAVTHGLSTELGGPVSAVFQPVVLQHNINAEMATITPRTMPLRQDRNAPLFAGEADLLKRYLEDVEELTQACGKVTDRIKYAKYYCDPANEKVFRALESSLATPTWENFKKELITQYTVQEEEEHTLRTLDDFVWNRAKRGFKTRNDVVDYARQFKLQATSLIRQEIISDSEAGRMLVRALPEQLSQRLTSRLEVKFPDHLPNKPYSMQQLCDGLLWVAESMVRGGGGTGVSPAAMKEEMAPAVKTESAEVMAFAGVLRGLTEAVQRLGQGPYGGGGGRSGPAGVGRGMGPAPAYGGGMQASNRSQACNFCNSLDHFIRNCPRVDEYVAANRCIRNERGQVTLPNGQFLPSWARGRTMMERFDNYHEQQGQFNDVNQRPTVSQSLYEVSAVGVEGSGGEGEPYQALLQEEERLRSLELMAAEVRKRIERKRDVVEAVEATKKGPTGAREPPAGRRDVGGKGKEKEKGETGGVKVVPRAEVKDGGSGPQFRYHSAAEDISLVKAVMDRALGGTVEVSQRELLAIAPDLRRQMKEMTTTKRTPISGAAAMLLDEGLEAAEVNNLSNVSREHDAAVSGRHTVQEDGTVLVAEDSLPLQCVDVVVNNQVIEGVLDGGSQVCSMSQKKWKELSVPIRSDKKMVLEAANLTTSTTMGVVENLPIRIGDVELCLQVQVMRDAPYDLLLGRPFYSLAECVTKDFNSGEQYLTMKDPNTGHEITVPTRNRVRPKGVPAVPVFQTSRSR